MFALVVTTLVVSLPCRLCDASAAACGRTWTFPQHYLVCCVGPLGYVCSMAVASLLLLLCILLCAAERVPAPQHHPICCVGILEGAPAVAPRTAPGLYHGQSAGAGASFAFPRLGVGSVMVLMCYCVLFCTAVCCCVSTYWKEYRYIDSLHWWGIDEALLMRH